MIAFFEINLENHHFLKGGVFMENEKEKEVISSSEESSANSPVTSTESEAANCCYQVISPCDYVCDPCCVPTTCCC